MSDRRRDWWPATKLPSRDHTPVNNFPCRLQQVQRTRITSCRLARLWIQLDHVHFSPICCCHSHIGHCWHSSAPSRLCDHALPSRNASMPTCQTLWRSGVPSALRT